MRLQIAQIGEEVLRAPANELSREEILSAKTQELIEHMRDTMHRRWEEIFGGTVAVLDPSTGRHLAALPDIDREGLEVAVNAARTAFPK